MTLSSCGAKVASSEVKEFKVHVAAGDEALIPIVKLLVQNYNQYVGLKALEYVDSQDQANSRIYLVEGLEKRDGKVGWGQWFSETERTGVNVPGSTIDEKIRYTLQAEFDADFFRANSGLENGQPSYELQKLFAHEIGHGFQLDHSPEASDVMYFDVTGTKDFATYWPRVLAFFSN